MKIAAAIAGILLGGLFIMSASTVLFKLADMPPPPENSLPWHFMAAVGPTGYLTMVKIVELIGGLLVLVPKTRNIGLLFLGPVIVNILAFHQFVAKDGIFQPMLLGIAALSLFLLWTTLGGAAKAKEQRPRVRRAVSRCFMAAARGNVTEGRFIRIIQLPGRQEPETPLLRGKKKPQSETAAHGAYWESIMQRGRVFRRTH